MDASDSKRRRLLEWLGKGCVLALGGAPLLAACNGSNGAPGGDTVTFRDASVGRDASRADGAVVGDKGVSGDLSSADGAFSFPFEPGGGHSVLEGWPERTVDPQDLSQILASWNLRVEGLVEQPHTYRFADLLQLERSDPIVDFHCVEGWSIHDVPWNGVHLQQIVDKVRPKSSATHVTFYTIDRRYNESLPLDVALEPRSLLAYGIGGATLPVKHGFPLRLVVPRLFGYKSAKFVDTIEFTDEPVRGYWVKYGYVYEAEVPASRLRPGKY